jgi:hypothetical protein
MEVIQNRYNNEVVIRRINHNTLHILSDRTRFKKRVKDGVMESYEFNGGPLISLNSKIQFEGLFWKVNEIRILDSPQSLNEIRVDVSPIY